MTLLNYGQPEDGIIQMAYVVEDIESAMGHWTASLGAGPWFLLPHFTGDRPTYRGGPSRADVAIAMGFSGHMLIELIAPNDEEPSVYREVIERSGYGFHHFGVGTRNYDADLERHRGNGFELAFQAYVPTGGRVGYLDTKGALPGFLELIELSDATETAFTRFYAASLSWDGKDPVRSFA
jgi:hypothetical protein